MQVFGQETAEFVDFARKSAILQTLVGQKGRRWSRQWDAVRKWLSPAIVPLHRIWMTKAISIKRHRESATYEEKCIFLKKSCFWGDRFRHFFALYMEGYKMMKWGGTECLMMKWCGTVRRNWRLRFCNLCIAEKNYFLICLQHFYSKFSKTACCLPTPLCKKSIFPKLFGKNGFFSYLCIAKRRNRSTRANAVLSFQLMLAKFMLLLYKRLH